MMLRGLVLATLLWWMVPPGTAAAEVVAEEDGAPILLLYAPAHLGAPIAAGLSDVVRRDGGAFVDLSPKKEQPTTASLTLQHAVAAYQNFDYGRAMDHLRGAIDEAESRGGKGLSSSELSDLFIYRALVRNAQGDTSSAWDDFVQAAVIDPTRHLDAVRFSPSVASSFERARTQVNEGQQARVRVGVHVECKVFLDARPLAPATEVVLRHGRHFLQVACAGYEAHASLVLVDGSEIELKPALRPIAIPERSKLLDMAKARGFRHLIWAHVTDQGAATPTTIFELLRVDGSELARTSIALGSATSNRAAVQVAVSRLLDNLAPPEIVAPVITKAATPWYRKPWFWATAGVVATSAVLLPFALRDDSTSGFDVRLGGATP